MIRNPHNFNYKYEKYILIKVKKYSNYAINISILLKDYLELI